MAEPKIQFGLSKAYYAVRSVSTTGAISYGTPVAIPGAVALALAAQGEMSRFYADNVEYSRSENNQGYSGDLTVARFPDKMRQDIWGDTLDTTSKVLTEHVQNEAVVFALLFQTEANLGETKHVIYDCTATRPSVTHNTKTESLTPDTETCTITSTPRPDGKVQARTTADTTATVSNTWFTSVYVAN